MDFRTGGRSAEDVKLCADSLSAFPHSDEAKVALTAGLHDVFFDTGRPFQWKFTRQDLNRLLAKLNIPR